eukprot:gene12131-5622_t
MLTFKKVVTQFKNIQIRNYAKKKLLVLGGGWSGYRLVKDIDLNKYDVKIISPRNHFLFTPLLAGASTGTLEFRDISEPLQQARIHNNYSYVSASVKKINKDEKTIECYTEHREDPHFKLKYDKLVVAVGCDVNTMGIKGVQEHACFMKELRDARWIRHKIIDCFEHASTPSISMETREKLLRFVVVGAGPTGIEASAEIYDFIRQDLKKLYPSLYLDAKITVVEASPTVLSAFDAQLQEYAQNRFRRQHIQIKLGTRVTGITDDYVEFDDGSKIKCSFVLWSAGIQPRKLIALDDRSPGIPKDPRNRVIVDESLKVKGVDDIYAMGDCSVVEGKEYAATAQVAQQQGKYLAKKLNEEAEDETKEYPKNFIYHHFGSMAYIGGYKAVTSFGTTKLKGFISWFLWRSAYLTKTVSLKNKMLIPINWTKTFLFGRDITKF